MSAARNCPTVFDPAAFVEDLQRAGCDVVAYRPIPRGGEEAAPSSYLIRLPEGGSGGEYAAVMSRWETAIEACPDHAERMADYVFTCAREARR